MARQHNFSAGPATLPISVLEELQGSIQEFQEMSAGIMEISHRSGAFAGVVESAQEKIRSLMDIPKDYSVLFLQGGASLQFYMCPLNLLSPGESADYITTGAWSQKAIKEATRVSDAKAIWDGKEGNFAAIPEADGYQVRGDSHYVHYTSNNTIFGSQWHSLPETGGIPLIADMSSDICSRPVDVTKHGIIYAGAQKNLGPSGVTVVILSPWALERSKTAGQSREGGLPSMLDYALMADKGSMFNTPNTWGIFALERILNWLQQSGGLNAMEKQNKAKADKLYAEIDRTDFWKPHAQNAARSWMNITWRAPSEELEATFVKDAAAEGLNALKGHRSVGGIRASIYNACSPASVDALVNFMEAFEKKNG